MAKEAQYKIAFSEHPIHENLERLTKQVADLPSELLEAAREHDAPAFLPRLEPALEFVGALLASADTALVTQQMLDDLNESIQQISSALTPFQDSSDFEQVPTIQSGVEALLNRSLRIAPAIGVWAKTDARKAAAQLGEASTEKTRQLQQQASDLQGQIDQLQEQANQASESVKADAEARINEALGQLDTLKTEAEAERTRVQEAIDNFTTRFDAEEQTRTTRFDEIQKELAEQNEQAVQSSKEAADEALKAAQESAQQSIDDLAVRTGEIIGFLEEKKQEAIDLVDAEATSSTAGAFQREAEEQRYEANLWRMFALLGGGVAVLVALIAVGLAVEGLGNGTSTIIAKVTAVTLLLGIAGYAAGQSGQHRRREQRARRLYLQMVAFKPFSEPLPDPEKMEVRKEFIERMFVGDLGEELKDGGDVKVSDENLSVLLKFIDLVRSGSGPS